MNTEPDAPPNLGTADHAEDEIIHGRRYHGYHKGLYMCPCDDDEKDRLDVMHYLVYECARRGQRYKVPLTRTTPEGEFPALRILDVGCGTGIWALEVADEVRDAEVVGIDLSLIQPPVVAPNLRFRRKDFESPWVFGENSWDLIHLGMLCGSVMNWTELYHNIWRHLRPGIGHIEQVEIDFEPRCDDGSLPMSSKWREWYNRYLTDATERRDRPIAYNHNTPQILLDNGFIDVEQTKIRIPVGEWIKGKIALGRWYRLALGWSLKPLSLAPLTRSCYWNEHDVNQLCDDVDNYVRDAQIHAYNDLYIITGRRPGPIAPLVRAGL